MPRTRGIERVARLFRDPVTGALLEERGNLANDGNRVKLSQATFTSKRTSGLKSTTSNAHRCERIVRQHFVRDAAQRSNLTLVG